jgi:succinate dehydrogenase/fumarate reductase flavoprotein subunit
MWKYRPDLGPKGRRQDLCLAFCREVKEGRGPIYLDLSAADDEGKKLCRHILPETFKAWERAGVDPFDKPMEWVPAFYGTLSTSGGIDIDLNCASSLEGLFAAGDASSAAANGAGGPGGAAYPYAAVSGFLAGAAAGRYAAEKAGQRPTEKLTSLLAEKLARLVRPVKVSSGPTSEQLIAEMQKVLFPFSVSFLKSKESLKQAVSRTKLIRARCPEIHARDNHELVKAWEANNMVELAELFLTASLMRTESRGFHFREDFPRTDNVNWLKWICWRKQDEELKSWMRDIPTPYIKPDEDYQIPPGIVRA